LCIAELNRNGIYESARSIVTLQEKKNCLTRLAELFNTRSQPLLPWFSAAASLDTTGSTGGTVANASTVAASTILAGSNGSEVDQIVDNSSMVLQDEGVISIGVANLALPTSSAASSPSSSLAGEPIVTAPLVATRSRGRKSAATKLAEEEAENKRIRLASATDRQTTSFVPLASYVTATNSDVQILVDGTTDMPPLIDINEPFNGVYGIHRGRPIWNGALQPDLGITNPSTLIPPLIPSNAIVNPNVAPLGNEIIEPPHNIVAPILLDANARKVAENRKAFVCDKVLDYVCKSGVDVDAAAIGRKTVEFGAAFDTLVSLGMIDPLAFVTPTTVPLVAGAISPTAVASSLKVTPLDQWFAPVRQEEIDNLREIVEIFERFDVTLDTDLSNTGLWYQKALKVVSRPFLRVSDILFMLNVVPILNQEGTFGVNDITAGHSLFKIISKNTEYMTIQHVHTVGVMNNLFAKDLTIKIPLFLAVLSQNGVTDLLQSGHLTGLTIDPPLGKLQAVDRKGKLRQFRTAESLNKLSDMAFIHGISNENRSIHDERLFGNELTNLDAELFATQLIMLADMEKTNRGVGGVSLVSPATSVLDIVSSIGPLVSGFDVWINRQRFNRFIKGIWSEQERDSLSLLNFQAAGVNGLLKFPTSMGDIAMLLQNFEYVFQVIGDASWSGLVRGINHNLNFVFVGLSLDFVYVMNTIHSHICALTHWMTFGLSPDFPIHSLVLVQKESSARLVKISLSKLEQITSNNLVIYNADKFSNVPSLVIIPKKVTEEKGKPGKEDKSKIEEKPGSKLR
jgi:hypothetical protein